MIRWDVLHFLLEEVLEVAQTQRIEVVEADQVAELEVEQDLELVRAIFIGLVALVDQTYDLTAVWISC
jgi:hypothetical protein